MKKLASSVILLLFVLTGCSQQSYEPREISPTTDICKVCNMSISQMDYAAQIVFKNGDHNVYDDLGCLMADIIEKGDEEIGAAYIKDAKSHQWINVKEATYVYASDIWTPMNYGVVAFASDEEADNYVQEFETAKQLTYKDLLTFEWGIHTHE